MKSIFFIGFLKYIFALPHLLLFRIHCNEEFAGDLERWRVVHDVRKSGSISFLYFFLNFREFRTIFYYRYGRIAGFLKVFCPPQVGLYIAVPRIARGLYIQHGFSTIITAKSIGENAWINQQVTIGYADPTGCPVIGDNVTIGAGAIVLGNVHIGSGTTIGAGAVVVKDVPENCTVVGAGARIIKRGGVRVNETL